MTTRQRGDLGEELARGYLERLGYTLIAEKYYAKGGEIDLVMRDGDECVFVEVKLRRSRQFGSGAESIGRIKRIRLRRAAYNFVLRNHIRSSWRIDVVVVDLSSGEPQFDHLKSAVGED